MIRQILLNKFRSSFPPIISCVNINFFQRIVHYCTMMIILLLITYFIRLSIPENKLNKIMQVLLSVVLMAGLALSLAPCEPFGLRVYYGDVLIDQQSPEKAAVYFNTNDACPNSFVNIISSQGFKKILCVNTAVATSSFVNYYTANIHSCSLSSIPYDQGFSYIAYGWDSSSQADPVPHKNTWVDLKLIDPTPKDQTVRVVALADWGNIEANIGFMTPILDDLKKVIQDQNINALLIAGDIAYDLDSDYGDTYVGFLQLLEEFSATTPIFHVPGNHQRRTPDSSLLFNTTFKIYGLDTKLATGLSFGSLFVLPFDPYNVVYGKVEEVSSFAALQTELENGVESGRFILPSSHYPLICSGQASQCSNNLASLQKFFGAMLSSGVSLYVGAHTHSYERNYPYFNDKSFQALPSPYQSDGGYLLSVVEGVAGNDVTIVETMESPQSYTAAYTVNETGFGVIESTQQQVTYSHFSTKQGFMDQFVIVKPAAADKAPKKIRKNLIFQEASS